MEVPSAVLQKLVCERCSGYLSRGPVHLLENNKYRCGRCPWTEDEVEEEGIRVEAYEELAKLMTFPCKYKDDGCTSKVPFLYNKQHEEACPFREYLCPVTESGQCDWTGLQKDVLEHCQQDHPTKVLPDNPCSFNYDITRPSLNNYVMFVFEVLFLIQSKVCAARRKIYHAVRIIDDPGRACDFKFTLDIRNNGRVFSTDGYVFPRELLVLEEDTSVVTGINCLLDMLEDFTVTTYTDTTYTDTIFTETTFTLTIESSGQGTSRSSTQTVTVLCGACRTVTEPRYRGDWLCREHAPKPRMCKYKTEGCTYSDIDKKCQKHQLYYCQYKTWCVMCLRIITDTTLDAHYTQAHGDITHRAGTVFTVSRGTSNTSLILECDFGRVVCDYRLRVSDLVLSVRTPLPSAQLHMYRCTVDLSHPDTGDTLTCTPAVLYNNFDDWAVCVSRFDHNTYVPDNEINMKINITKI